MDVLAGLGHAGFGPLDRELLLHTLISGGGALLLAYAMYLWATDRASPLQLRGLVAVGAGFLTSAAASMYLREAGPLGAAVSLAGTFAAMGGMLVLVRERRDRLESERRRSRGRPD